MSKRSHSNNDLAAAIARARAARGLPNAEAEEVELRCPLCGGTAPESEFDEVEVPDTDEESDSDGDDDADGFRTDPVTSTSTGNADDVNQGDAAQVPTWNDRHALARAIARDLSAASTRTE
jgi:hypothetical protein